MSHDASNNPAELVGVDGTICYRKEGGSCVEINGVEAPASRWDITTIGGHSAIVPTASTPLSSPRDVILEDVWIKDGGEKEDSDITFNVVTGGGGGGGAAPHPPVEYV